MRFEDIFSKLRRTKADADPTQYTPLARDERFKRITVPTDKGTRPGILLHGERYIEIFPNAEGQKFVADLLKGVLNVSDIIEVKGNFFSRIMPLEKIEHPTSYDEEVADDLILLYVFSDNDHWRTEDGIIDPDYGVSEMNLRRRNSRVVYYDFGRFTSRFLIPSVMERVRDISTDVEVMTSHALAHLRDKLSELKDRLGTGTDDSLFYAIVANSGVDFRKVFPQLSNDTREEATEYIRSELSRRINIMLDAVMSQLKNDTRANNGSTNL